jgi:hypothetical protein
MNIPPSYRDPCDRSAFRAEMSLLTAAAMRGRPDPEWHQHIRDLEWLASLSDMRQMLGRGALVDDGAVIEFEVAQ